MLRIFAALLILAAIPVEAAKVPRPLPNMEIDPPLGGKPIKFSDYKGKVMVIVLFTTECGSCKEMVSIMSRMQTQFGPQGVQVLGAAVNRGAITLISGFIGQVRPAFPVGVLNEEQTRRLADFTDRPFVPILMFVDRKGVVQQQFFGDHQFLKEIGQTAPALLRNLLNKK